MLLLHMNAHAVMLIGNDGEGRHSTCQGYKVLKLTLEKSFIQPVITRLLFTFLLSIKAARFTQSCWISGACNEPATPPPVRQQQTLLIFPVRSLLHVNLTHSNRFSYWWWISTPALNLNGLIRAASPSATTCDRLSLPFASYLNKQVSGYFFCFFHATWCVWKLFSFSLHSFRCPFNGSWLS